MSTQPPNTIVLIHGLWMTPLELGKLDRALPERRL
jgi:hypothetical protein